MYRTRPPRADNEVNAKLNVDDAASPVWEFTLKDELVRPAEPGTSAVGAATGYITCIGRRERFRLLTPNGECISELHTTPDLINVKASGKELDPKKSRIDACSAKLRAEMLAEHLLTDDCVIRVESLKG